MSQPFVFTEKDSFRDLLRYLRPTINDKDIPRRTKITEEVYAEYTALKVLMKEKLAVCALPLFVCIY
jgi:hypothetical protein